MKINDKFIKNLIKNLIKNIEMKSLYDIQSKELNIVLEGGGFNGAYEIGIMMFLQKMQEKKHIKINKISGVSIGSIIGILFLINKLEYYDKFYKIICKDWNTKYDLKQFDKLVNKVIINLDDNEFDIIKNDKLYISFFDLQKKQHITISKFTSKQHLIETILKTTHIPMLKTKKITYIDKEKNHFIDGLYPYIFNEDDVGKKSKVLYVSINGINMLKKCLNNRNEDTSYSRIMYGILNCYDLFRFNKASEICSYIDEWGIYALISYNMKKILLYMVMYIIWGFNKLNIIIKKLIHNKIILNQISSNIDFFVDIIIMFLIM